MVDIVIPFPDDLRSRAETAAQERGISLDEFVRSCVITTVDRPRHLDPMFAGIHTFDGDAPHDLSVRHDDYLYGEDA